MVAPVSIQNMANMLYGNPFAYIDGMGAPYNAYDSMANSYGYINPDMYYNSAYDYNSAALANTQAAQTEANIQNNKDMQTLADYYAKSLSPSEGLGGAILGIIGGVTTMLILKYALKRKPYTKMNYLFVADFIVPAILVAQAIGRWGNFFNNEVNGYPISVEYFAFLPTFVKNQMMYADHGSSSLQPGMIYLPLFFIEFCTNLIGYFVLYYGFGRKYFSKWFIKFTNLFIKDKDKKLINVDSYHADGTLVGGYLVWYGVTRAILEPLRTGSDYFKSSEITSYVMIGGGILIIIFFILFKALYLDRKPLKEVGVQKDE